MATSKPYQMVSATDAWPSLALKDWQDTQETLHRWTQIVGKVKLALTPFLNEWWNVAFSVTPRGLTTGTIPNGDEAFSVDFDFIEHHLSIHTSDGRSKVLLLRPRSVTDFHAEFLAALRELGIDVAINPMPVEIVDPVAFHLDEEHAAFDANAVQRWWRILLQTEKVLQRYRTSFAGKSSPVMFFWGSFDLTAVRFSGRSASLSEGAPEFMRLAEDQENIAVGFWPGNANYAGITLGEPAFNAYIFPEPEGFSEAKVQPREAYYHIELGQFILPYDAVRTSPAPEETLLAFYQSVYEAAATLAGWDRKALELERGPSQGAA